MKKTLSILLVAMMVMAMAVTASAASESSIQLGADAESGQTLVGGLLKPGEEYRFPVSVSIDGGEMTALTDDILKEYNLRIGNTGEGKTLTEAKLSKSGGVYYLAAAVKAGWPAEQTEEEYSFKLVRKSDNKTVFEGAVNFYTGYEIVDDAVIDALDAGDEIEVDNKAPAYAKEQLERVAKRNSYKKVTFSGSNWNYEVNITDMPGINMVHNNNGIKEILTKYEDNSFEFLTFPAGPRFTTVGVMSVDVSDILEDFEGKFFLYRYLDGKLTLIPARLNAEDETLAFSTDTLGRFVITDKEIKDAVVAPPSNGSNGSSGSNGSNNGSSDIPNQNPNTGAGAAADLSTAAVMLAMIATLSGGVAILRNIEIVRPPTQGLYR